MPYFTFTRQNLNLDLLLDFNIFIALWKTNKNKKQIAQFLQRYFAKIFAQTPLKRIGKILVFLDQIFRFSRGGGVFKVVYRLNIYNLCTK